MKKTLLLSAVFLLGFTACDIKEDRDDCPGGETRIRVYAEKFQHVEGAGIPANSEAQFNARLETMNFYLYKDGDLVEQGLLNVSTITAQTYDFVYPSLTYGDYSLVLLGNTTNNMPLTRKSDVPDRDLVYPGAERTEDYFTDRFDFKVENRSDTTFVTQLKRVQGVVRFNFINIPAYITGIEVDLDELSSHYHLGGSYTDEYTFSRLLPEGFERDEQNNHSYSILAFPTLENERTSWRVKLYRDGDDLPYYDQIVQTDLHLLRNQLLDLTMNFGSGGGTGEFSFHVNLDEQWDGWHDVGGPVMNQ